MSWGETGSGKLTINSFWWWRSWWSVVVVGIIQSQGPLGPYHVRPIRVYSVSDKLSLMRISFSWRTSLFLCVGNIFYQESLYFPVWKHLKFQVNFHLLDYLEGQWPNLPSIPEICFLFPVFLNPLKNLNIKRVQTNKKLQELQEDERVLLVVTICM